MLEYPKYIIMVPQKIKMSLVRLFLIVLLCIVQSENGKLYANTEPNSANSDLSNKLQLLKDHLRWGTNLDSASLLSQQAKALIDDKFSDSKKP